MSGLVSHKATTTMRVVDDPDMTPEKLLQAVVAAKKAGGWLREEHAEEGLRWAAEDATELARMAGAFRVGMLVEKRGNKIQERRELERGLSH